MTQTVTSEHVRRDVGMRRLGRVMRAVGLVGVLGGIAAVAIGLWLLRDLDVLLGRSLVLTAESLTAVDSSLDVATESVAVVGDGLVEAERTSRGLQQSLDEGADVLEETARLTRGDVASSLESVQRSLPALIQVGDTIDTTLRAVDRLPAGPSYEPEEPFAETLQALQEDLDSLPGDLRDQADTIDEAGDNLRDVGAQGVAVADALTEVRTSLDDTGEVLGQYRTTAGEARGLLERTTEELDRRLTLLRVLVVVLGLIYCAGQLLPWYLGHRMATASEGTLSAFDDG